MEIDEKGHESAAILDKALGCVFVSIETERKKEKGFLFRKPGEEIAFLIQVLWPFALVEQPSGKKVIFDSLGILKRQIRDGNVTRCEEFSEQIKNCIPSLIKRSEFFERLEKYRSYFKDFDTTEIHEIRGCFPEMKMVHALATSFSLAGPKELDEPIHLTSILDTRKARELLNELAEFKAKALRDIETLSKSTLPLDPIVAKWEKQIDDEIGQNRKHYHARIEEIRPDVARKVSNLGTERDEKLKPIQPEISRLEAEVRQLEEFVRIHEAEETEAKDDETQAVEDLEQADDDLQEAREELEIEEQHDYEDPTINPAIEAAISRLETRIAHLEKRISRAQERVDRAHERAVECMRRCEEAQSKVDEVERLLDQKREEYDRLHSHYGKLIADQQRRITDLEDERDSISDSLKQESLSISAKMDGIRQDIENLVRRKELLIKEIDNLEVYVNVPSSKKETETYAYVPFFVALFKGETGSRFLVIPPSRMRRERGTLEKVGQFLFGKVPILSEPRDESFTKLSLLMAELLTTNHSVSKEILQNAYRLNLLSLHETREQVIRGIRTLRNEGFLNNKTAQKLETAFRLASRASNDNFAV